MITNSLGVLEKGLTVDMSRQQPDGQGLPPSLRILVVEDHADTAATSAILLRKYGHEVQVASDGPRAIALAVQYRPDVVLLDIGLPGMNGYEVAKTLRQNQLNRMLLIATTGYGQIVEERLSSYEAGIDLHLTKPVSVEEVVYYLARFQEVARPCIRPAPHVE